MHKAWSSIAALLPYFQCFVLVWFCIVLLNNVSSILYRAFILRQYGICLLVFYDSMLCFRPVISIIHKNSCLWFCMMPVNLKNIAKFSITKCNHKYKSNIMTFWNHTHRVTRISTKLFLALMLRIHTLQWHRFTRIWIPKNDINRHFICVYLSIFLFILQM